MQQKSPYLLFISKRIRLPGDRKKAQCLSKVRARWASEAIQVLLKLLVPLVFYVLQILRYHLVPIIRISFNCNKRKISGL